MSYDINLNLLKKYNRPGPRYTSYPPATKFSGDFKWQDFKTEIIRTNKNIGSDYSYLLSENIIDDGNKNLSLYFHLPFCETLCYFCGCNMVVTNNRETIGYYIDVLKKEIDILKRYVSSEKKVIQLHWGGGTPSYLKPDEISDLMFYIRSSFNFSRDIETGIEINPRGLTFEHLTAIRETGFNRISFGVQDFNPDVQHAVNRIQPEDLVRDVMNTSRELGFHSINIDLIYGLPYQTLASFENTVEKIIKLSPDRIALFNFAYIPKLKRHQRLIREETLPVPEEKLNILKMTIQKLTHNEYIYIGMDHFAKPDDELSIAQKNKTLHRNFQGYSTKAGCDLYALGMTSISKVGDVFAQNEKTLQEYYSAIKENRFATMCGYKMNDDDKLREHLIMRLMCDLEINKRNIEKKFEINFDEYFHDAISELKEFENDGLIIYEDSKVKLTESGRLLVRNIAMTFDSYIKTTTATFSRTV